MEAPLDPLMAVRTAHPLRDPIHPLTAAQGAQDHLTQWVTQILGGAGEGAISEGIIVEVT